MAGLKSLAKDTAIYGLSSIIGKFLNYWLTPIYTIYISAESGGYGVVTNIYAWVALLMVLLTFGMETGFFRFANKGEDDPIRVYSTTLLGVAGVSLSAMLCGLIFLRPIANVLGYSEHPWYVGIMIIVISLDAIKCIPYAYLRYQKRPVKFASLQLLNILLTIILTVIYFVFLHGHDVFYVFVINLVCTCFILLCMFKELTGFRYQFDKPLFRRMFSYCFPLLILGIAGIMNQVADKILFPYIYPDKSQAIVQLGIYGACSKIAMIMAMLTQAFRYAYEPFVFGKSREKDNREMYAKAMKYFIIFTLLAYLAVICYMDVLKFIIGRSYWEGLRVVPIVMMAEIFMGIYFNLSFWYKLIDKTQYGAYFSIAGCAVLVLIDVLLIPRYSYMACAWAGLAGYGTAMVLSYFFGQSKYPIRYDLKTISAYALLAAVIYVAATKVPIENMIVRLLYRSLLLCIFMAYICWKDFPIKQVFQRLHR